MPKMFLSKGLSLWVSINKDERNIGIVGNAIGRSFSLNEKYNLSIY